MSYTKFYIIAFIGSAAVGGIMGAATVLFMRIAA